MMVKKRMYGAPTQNMLDYAYALADWLDEDVPWSAEPTFDEVSSYISDARSRWEMSDEYRDEMLAEEARMDCIDFRRDW